MRPFTIPSQAWSGFKGYVADANNAGPQYLAPPSINCLIDENGVAETRMGIEGMSWDLNVANKAGKALYIPTYDVTFIAIDTKVKYIDHNNGNAVVDTGISLTAGTVTRLAYNRGDLWITNTTDGIIRILITRLNGAASAGATSLTLDRDGAARLSVFGDTSGDIRVNGTDEEFSGVTVSTGVLAVTALTQEYTDNTIAVFIDNSYSSLEEPSKIVFWKERMHIMGFPSAGNVDQPNNTVLTGQFVVGQTGATSIELIADFTYGTGGSTKIPLGDGGSAKNLLAAKDYLYFFKENQSYVAGVGDVTTSGSAIGETIPQLRDENFGCLNEDSAVSMGNGEIAYITNDKRLMRIRIATENGAPVVFPDESFDIAIRKLLNLMDDDQTGALVFYHKGKRRLHVQVKIQAQWITLIYDNNIRAWQPPITGWFFSDYFERKGVLYALAGTDDTVYKLYSTLNDNGSAIECVIATGVFDIDDSAVDSLRIKGTITQPTSLYIRTPVNEGTTQTKTILGSSYSYGTGSALNSFSLGSQTLNADALGDLGDTAKYKKVFDVFPRDGNNVQLIASCLGDSHYFSVKTYQFFNSQHSKPNTPLS